MHDFPFTEKSNRVVNIGIVRQAEDIIIGKSGLLFWCDFVRTTFVKAVDGRELTTKRPLRIAFESLKAAFLKSFYG